MMKNLELKIPPPILVSIIGLLMWLWNSPYSAHNVSVIYAGTGMVTVAIGITILIFSVRSFRKAKTTISPTNPENASVLVDTGIFGLTRNPMYVGMTLILIGWVIYLGNVLYIFGPIFFVLYVTRFQIIPEERILTEKWGDQYLRYKQRTDRWI